MTDDKHYDEQEANVSAISAAEEAAAIFRAAEEEARRARNPYQSAVTSSSVEEDYDNEYDEYDEHADYEDGEEYDEVEETSSLPQHSPTEIRFINRTDLDEQDVRRLVERIFDGKKGVQGYRIFLLIFSVLVVGYAIFNIVKGLTQGPATYAITGSFLLVMACVMFYMGFKGVVNQTYKRTLKNAQGFMTLRTYHFYDGDFSQTTEDNSYSVPWEKVANWTEDEYSFYIIIGQSYAIVHKNGFTMGNEESFRQYLESKSERRKDVKRRF